MSRRARNISTVRRRGTNSRLALLGVLLTAISLMIGALGCDSGPDYLEIRDWHDLNAMRGNLGGHYILMNHLDSTTAGYGELASNTANRGKGWQPTGIPDDPLAGASDGQGYGIRDMLINRPDGSAMGLIAAVDGGGLIQNVRTL